jgi:2-polyprenyl-6-methoxyphenol hydroxylase-like FAD-dependent oxidoreductase
MTAPPPRATPRVLIVGAGPTGLALALWLTRLGVGLRIIDRAAEPGTTSRALGVQALTLELYRQIGIADAVTGGGVQAAGVNLWVSGAGAARLPLRDIGEGLTPFPSILIFPQDAHERLLIDRLHALGVDVERGTELAGFDQDPGGVHATLRGPDGSEEVCDVALLAGCRVARRFRQGRAFLVGDAAHIHSPVGAQGMNTGIGDAVNLAWKVAAVVDGRGPDSLLDTYETERIGFARRLVGTTDRVFTVVVRQGPLAERVRTTAFPRVAPLLLRLRALRVWIFRTVSQIGVNYRGSPLSEGAAGPLRGGDRLPWVGTGRTGADEDNFAPLTSLRWQVHVYGEPAEGLAERCETLGLPLVGFPWSPDLGRTSGLRRGVLYLIRPDGYLALIDGEASPQRLEEYFTRRGLRP